MTQDKEKRTLIYKRTHEDDPDAATGVFGNNSCMGRVRSWEFNAVIGVGGIRPWAKYKGIARKLTWIGIGAHKDKMGDDGHPLVTFEHFLYCGEDGPLLEKEELAPNLARHMYGGNVRLIFDSSLPEEERLEVEKILDLARNEPPSGQLEGTSQRSSQRISSKCRSNSCRATSVARKAEQE